MKYKVVLPMIGVVLLVGCATVPITGRKQMNLANEGEMMAMANTEYGKFLVENQPLSPNDPNTIKVRPIGEKLAVAATKFLNDNNAGDRVANYDWQFNVVNDPAVNAWCMPGGKVVVYTGILPVTNDDAGLAVVGVGDDGVVGEDVGLGEYEPSHGIAIRRCCYRDRDRGESHRGAEYFHAECWYRFPIGYVEIQSEPRDRSRQDGLGLHGHGRIRST